MLQKSTLKHKNYSPLGCSEIVMFIPALVHRNFSHQHIIASSTYLKYKHWDLFNWQEGRSFKTQVFFPSWSCWIIESELEWVGKRHSFLSSCSYKNTSEWMELGFVLVEATPVSSLLGRILMLSDSAMAERGVQKSGCWGLSPGPGIYHIKDLKQNTSILCSSVSSSRKK